MRIIAHLDMDAFFAAIEERDKPRLKGLPIIIGTDPKDGRGRGAVSTANYKAREYGIKSALPISKAWLYSQEAKNKGLPEAIFITPNFSKYEASSKKIIEIISKYSFQIEQASIDEAYFDLSHLKTFKKAQKTCQQIKLEIKNKEKLTASIGIGPNKLIAKIASDFQKPNGLTVVEDFEKEKFLELLPIRKIPGVGPKTEELFKKQNVKIVSDLKKYSQKDLEKMLGKWGTDLYQKIRGIDNSLLIEEWEAKSISEQETFESDTDKIEIIIQLIQKLSGQVFNRFQKSDFASFQTIGITIRFSDFITKSRAHTLSKPLTASEDSRKIFEFEILKLLFPFLDMRENPQHKKIRLLGVKIEKFTNK